MNLEQTRRIRLHRSGKWFPFFPVPLFLMLLFTVSLLPTSVRAQGEGRVVYQPKVTREKGLHPYLIGYLGYGDPADKAFGQVFDSGFMRAGGGFGMRFPTMGAEVLFRAGSINQTRLISDGVHDDQYRNFSYSTTEVELRLYATPRIGSFYFPSGVGLGLSQMTVDRGYPGLFDRFGSSGLFVSPFTRVEYRFEAGFSLGLEAEYSINHLSFEGSQTWQREYGGATYTAHITPAGNSFWDTVGGSRHILEDDIYQPYNYTFNNGGLIVALRVAIDIPTYIPKK